MVALSSYSFYKKINIYTNGSTIPVGGTAPTITSASTQFPFCVAILESATTSQSGWSTESMDNLFVAANSSGRGVGFFTSTASTETLSYEVESFTTAASSRAWYGWVKAPTLTDTGITSIYLGYG